MSQGDRSAVYHHILSASSNAPAITQATGTTRKGHIDPTIVAKICELDISENLSTEDSSSRKYHPSTLPPPAEPSFCKVASLYETVRLFIARTKAPAIIKYLPLVNRYSLRQVDIGRLVKNVKLRHQLIFKEDLIFKPCIKLSEKDRGFVYSNPALEEESAAYWSRVSEEIKWLVAFQNTKSGNPNESLLYLPLFFIEIREILLEIKMIPHEKVCSQYDVEHLISLMDRGVKIPFSPFASGLLSLLEPHCISKKSKEYLLMVHGLCQGQFDPWDPTAQIVYFLQCLQGLIEYVRLEIANTDLRAQRSQIIKETCSFEFQSFVRGIKNDPAGIFHLEMFFHQLLLKIKNKGPVLFQDGTKDDGSRGDSKFFCQKEELFGKCFYSGIFKLISSESYQHPPGHYDEKGSNMLLDIPETLRLDRQALKKAFDSWQNVLVLQIVMTAIKVGFPSISDSDSERIGGSRGELLTILRSCHTTPEHVSVYLLSCVNRLRKERGSKEMSQNENTTLSRLCSSFLCNENRVHRIVRSHLKKATLQVIKTGAVYMENSELKKTGLVHLKSYLMSSFSEMKLVVDHNILTFKPLYEKIFDKHCKMLGIIQEKSLNEPR